MSFLNKNHFGISFFRRKSEHSRSLELILGFRPKNTELYRLALRHRSVVKGNHAVPASNERLEFLGDAVLTTVVSEYLFLNYPLKEEGDLTKMRTRLVNGFFLNELALNLGIGELLEAGIGENETPKSIYGDALEALIGAVYLERGYIAARHFVLHQLMNIEGRKEELINVEIDHKSKLIEWAQKNKIEISFRLSEDLSDEKRYNAELVVEGEFRAKGQGYTKKEAEQQAAKAFFDQIIEP